MGRKPDETALRREGAELLDAIKALPVHVRVTKSQKRRLIEQLGTNASNWEVLDELETED